MAIRFSQEANLTSRYVFSVTKHLAEHAVARPGTRKGTQVWEVLQVKRRWDDDVVFKNQARGEPKAQKRFINDTIRSDFHKRFLTRYIK